MSIDSKLGSVHINDKAISVSIKLIEEFQEKHKIPGLTVGVSVNGEVVWMKGCGYSDLEDKIPCTPDTVMKIASISKSITSVLLAKEVELGHIDLDTDIRTYISDLPAFSWQGEEVQISCRQLSCHMAGIRGYKPAANEFGYEEYVIHDNFPDVKSALALFVHDPLLSKPGDRFNYSNHGYSLLSRVIEATSKQPFQHLLNHLFTNFKLTSTSIEASQPTLPRDTSYYSLKDNEITKCPPMNSSYKMAAAGLLSTVADLLTFAHALLSCYYNNRVNNEKDCDNEDENEGENTSYKEDTNYKEFEKKNRKNINNVKFNEKKEKSFLSAASFKELWCGEGGTKVSWCEEGVYGLGWQRVEKEDVAHVGHTGRTVGASSVLIISMLSDFESSGGYSGGDCDNKDDKDGENGGEDNNDKERNTCGNDGGDKSYNLNSENNFNQRNKDGNNSNFINHHGIPDIEKSNVSGQGVVVVAILSNLGGVPLGEFAIKISDLFRNFC